MVGVDPNIQITLEMIRDEQLGIIASVCKSGSVRFFAPPKRATIDRNQSRTDPDIAGTEPDHLGLVFCGPWN